MNQDLQTILDFIEASEHLSTEEKTALIKATKDTDKALMISEFKLERTEKVKRTTAILLEETIEELEKKQKSIAEANVALSKSLEDLKAAQAQLIQSEKMASLGELTAGIAHEIQNPLNFVNNFSEVSKELLEEMQEELDAGNLEDVKEIANDVIQNLEKINHHGKRADGIVKGMLQHSRKNTGEKEFTDINSLVDEYLRLAYHGLRAKDKSFNATLETDFDDSIGKIEIVPQDIGRVVLNLITNAFYAAPLPPEGGFKDPHYVHKPTVWLSTKKLKESIVVSVRDNGPGIPKDVIDKIFQPFFTTKPTGQGTGLGLSLSYDILKAHGGRIEVQSQPNEGTIFTLVLPLTNK
jgi:signal transduction histidine kinase